MIYDDEDDDDEARLCVIKSPQSVAHMLDCYDFVYMKSK